MRQESPSAFLHELFLMRFTLFFLPSSVVNREHLWSSSIHFNSALVLTLSDVLPDALKTRCASCTDIQKAKALDAITRLYYQHPDKYLALAERYDPTGEYTRNFENWFDEQNAVKPRNNQGNQFLTRTTTRAPQPTANRIPTERTRIPSTWITTTTRPTTTSRVTSVRPTLRTLQPTVRSIETVFREAPTTQRFIPPVTQSTTLRATTTFRTTTRFSPEPVPRELEVKDVPRSPPQPAVNQPPVFIPRESTTTVRFIPTTSTVPPTIRTQAPTLTSPTFAREPDKSLQVPPQPSIINQPPVFFQREASTTARFIPTTATNPPTPRVQTQTQPSPSFVRVPEPDKRLQVPLQSTGDQPQPPVFEQRIPETVFTTTVRSIITQPPAQASRTIRPLTTQQPVATTPVFIAPDNERTQPRFGSSEPRTREIFANSEPNQPVSWIDDSLGLRQSYWLKRLFLILQSGNEPVDLIDNFFVPNGNRFFRRSINQLLITTGKVVDGFRGMVRSTIGVW